jgi:transposase-like protein
VCFEQGVTFLRVACVLCGLRRQRKILRRELIQQHEGDGHFAVVVFWVCRRGGKEGQIRKKSVMRGKAYTTEERIQILGTVEAGGRIKAVCQENQIAEQTLRRWKRQLGRADASETLRREQQENKNRESASREAWSGRVRA